MKRLLIFLLIFVSCSFNQTITQEQTSTSIPSTTIIYQTTTTIPPETTTTTVPATTTTTTTTTFPATTTTVQWSVPADSNEPIVDGTYENVCVSMSWAECALWIVYDEYGNDTTAGGIGPYPFSAFTSYMGGCEIRPGLYICGETKNAYAVVNGIYYPDD